MPEPSDELRQLAAQGRQLRAQYVSLVESRRTSSSKVSLGVGLLDAFFDLSGYKRAATHFGRLMSEDSSSKQEASLLSQYESWANGARNALRGMSVVRGRSVPRNPNSDDILRRFGRTRAFSRLDTKLSHGIEFLETLSDQHLVRNEDLASMRTSRQRIAHPGPPRKILQTAPVDSLEAEAQQVIAALGGFPDEREAVRGALEAHRRRGPDHGRQALSSMRNALENLVRRLSGETDWSAGMLKLMPSETRRRTVRQVHSYLSAYGIHGATLPSDGDVRMGLMLTLAAIRSLLASSDA